MAQLRELIVSGPSRFVGASTFNSDVVLNKGATSYADIVPGESSTHNLGNSTYRWKNFYITNINMSDTLTTTQGEASTTANTGDIQVAGGIGVAKNSFFGAKVYFSGTTYYISGTAANLPATTIAGLTVAGHLLPSANATYNLGSSSLKWNNVYATTFHGSLDGNASSATKLATARTISLTGSVTGSGTFDGSGNLSITTTTNHTHSYLPLSGGTMTGLISYKTSNHTSTPIAVYDEGNNYGHTIVLGAGGTTFVGAGESAGALRTALNTANENLYLSADSNIYFFTKCDTIGNRVAMIFDTARNLYPDTNNTGSVGTSSYKWNSMYATTFHGSLSGNASSASKVNNKLTVGSKTYDGSAAVTIAASDLGLASAMLFLGTTTTAITDGATTNPVTIGGSNKTVTAGNVVLYGSKEFVWTGSAWEELGNEGSYKIVQAAVADPSASGTSNTFIATISQDTNGKITATKKTVAVTNSAPTLAWGTTSTIGTVAGTNLQVKMPANPNTDTKVTQTAINAADYNYWRPLIWGSSNSGTEGFTPSTITDGVYTAQTLSCQPSTGTIRATTFKGSLSGNAATATKLATARTISLTGSVTGSGSFDGSGNLSINTTTNHNHSYLIGSYTGNGGQQNPNYFGTNKVGFLMMNTSVNNNSDYKDWIIMDCYSGSDVGGSVAFGVNRQKLGAYIMRSAAARTSWSESAELLHTSNYTSYTVTKTGSGASGTWGINVTGSAGSVAWGNVTGKPSTFTPASHTHNYAGSSSAGGSATSAVKLDTATAGSATQPVYFSGGKPTACTYTLGKSVPSNAVFTDTTYKAGTGLSLSGTTFNHSNSVTAGTAQGDANKTLTFGGTFTIPTVTYDAQGHITGKGTTTMTMPANPNTDYKVTQTAVTASDYTNWRPLVIGYSNSGTEGFTPYSVTDTTITASTISCQPSSGTIRATTFKGALSGNATTATKLTTARTISLTGSVTGSGSFDGSGNLSITTSTNHTHNYLPLSGGTMTGTINVVENKKPAINFRSASTYTTTLNYDTAGNEALALNLKNPVTSFMVNTGVDGATWTSAGKWSTVTPALQVKNNSVYINKLIPNGETPTYKLYVNGSAYINGTITATTFSGNLSGNADTASAIKDYSNDVLTRFGYSTSGMSSAEATWIGAWDATVSGEYRLRAIKQSDLRVATATKLQTARNIFGIPFDGTTDVAGKAVVYGAYTSTPSSRFAYSGIEIRENGLVTTTQSDIGYAPSIGFHWGGRIAATMHFHSDGNFYLRKQDGTSRATLDANLNGNATNADKLDGYHADSFLTKNGWWRSTDTSKHLNNLLSGIVFAYNVHGAPDFWGTAVCFTSGSDNGYNLQLFGSGGNNLYFRNRSTDHGQKGWLKVQATAGYGTSNPTSTDYPAGTVYYKLI